MSSSTQPTTRGRHWVRWALVVIFIVIPIIEITLIIEIGRAIGGWQTFGLLIVWSFLGAWLVRREWSNSWHQLREATRSGAVPARELADAVVVLVGGILLLVPGFFTDVIGLVLVLPFTRPIGRRLLQVVVGRRLMRSFSGVNVIPGETVPVTYTATPHDPNAPMAPGSPGAIEGKIVRD